MTLRRACTLYDKIWDAHTVATDEGEVAGSAYKHGCTNDVRELWADTRADVPEDLEGALRKAGLLDGAANKQKRPKRPMAHAVEKKKEAKKRHVNRANMKLTNTHLGADTEIGRLLKTDLEETS